MQLPGYQPSIGTQGMILRYFCTISPWSFIRIRVLYGALFGCSSCRSPVSENTPHTLASRQAAAKARVRSHKSVSSLFGLPRHVIGSPSVQNARTNQTIPITNPNAGPPRMIAKKARNGGTTKARPPRMAQRALSIHHKAARTGSNRGDPLPSAGKLLDVR